MSLNIIKTPLLPAFATASGLVFAGLVAAPIVGLAGTGIERALLNTAIYTVPVTPFVAVMLAAREGVNALNADRPRLSRQFSAAVCTGAGAAACMFALFPLMTYESQWAQAGFMIALGATAYLGGPLALIGDKIARRAPAPAA